MSEQLPIDSTLNSLESRSGQCIFRSAFARLSHTLTKWPQSCECATAAASVASIPTERYVRKRKKKRVKNSTGRLYPKTHGKNKSSRPKQNIRARNRWTSKLKTWPEIQSSIQSCIELPGSNKSGDIAGILIAR